MVLHVVESVHDFCFALVIGAKALDGWPIVDSQLIEQWRDRAENLLAQLHAMIKLTSQLGRVVPRSLCKTLGVLPAPGDVLRAEEHAFTESSH